LFGLLLLFGIHFCLIAFKIGWKKEFNFLGLVAFVLLPLKDKKKGVQFSGFLFNYRFRYNNKSCRSGLGSI
jgi:hypothetical protein